MNIYDAGVAKEMKEILEENERKKYVLPKIGLVRGRMKRKDEESTSLYDLGEVAKMHQIYSKKRRNPNL